MSIRFHRGPSIVTLFHDSTSPTSRQVLHLLSAYNARRDTVHHTREAEQEASAAAAASAPPLHGESDIVEAHNTSSTGGMEFLRQAAADLPPILPIELEIVDRRTNPPTSDQMRSIIDYLAADPSSSTATTSSAGSTEVNKGTAYTSSGFNATEHERRRKSLEQHLDQTSMGGSGMPKIKDGPLVVNWDEGFATTNLQGVNEMLKRLQQTSTPPTDKSTGSGGCTIS